MATGVGKAGRMAVRVGYLWAAEAAIGLMLVLPHELAWKLGLIIVAATAVVLLRMSPGVTLAAALVGVAVLLQVGAISASAVPGLAQVVEAKNSLDHWQARQTAIASCNYRQRAAAEAGDLARLDAIDAECAQYGQAD